MFLGLAIRTWLIIGAVVALLGLGYVVYNNIKEEGRNEVTTEIQEQNRKLDERVTNVNENITRRVVEEDTTIRRRSQTIEDAINEMPSEPISNVSRTRLERVRDQQRAIREANQETE